jgi:ABC-type bacteriocin/lantibiotic exporter with double-glycine peptidase domain
MGNQITLFFNSPLVIIFGLITMYFVLGITFLTAVGIMIIVLTCSYFLTKISQKLNQKVMAAKDNRMKSTAEMLDIIRYIKITTIEKFFYRKVDERREKEIAIEVRKTINHIFIIILFFLNSPLVLTVVYMTYILLGN